MKHGPNALIDENLPVVVLATRDPASEESRLLYEKTLSNIQEVKAREGIVVAIVDRGRRRGRASGRPRDRDSAAPRLLLRRFWRSCRCSCWRITSRCGAAATWISRAIWPRA
jgi:glutamine---fructose-6-phosphate transaminase (isomerizing)